MTTVAHNFDTASPRPGSFLRTEPQSLEVALDFGGGKALRPIGTLEWDDRRRQVVLQWDSQFMADPLPLSPVLVRSRQSNLRPRKGWAYEGVPALLGDSLPDGWGRQLANYEIRSLGGQPDFAGPLTRLSLVGQHGMGALIFRPAFPAGTPTEISLEWFATLAAKIDERAGHDALTMLRNASGGTHGQRPKMLAQLHSDGIKLRDHRLPLKRGWRHVLIKRRGYDDRNGMVEAEVAYGLMARAAGIKTKWMGTLESPTRERFFATERFDRSGSERFHVQTAAALFGVDFKTTTIDYIDLIKLTRALTRSKREVEELARRMIFNVRAVNRDDHLKNHAFLMDAAGKWSLAPAYDMVYSHGSGGMHRLSIAGNRIQPGPLHFHDVAIAVGIERDRIREIVSEVDAAIDQWPAFAEACAVPRLLRNSIQDDLECARSWT